jgi:hypothetical protein
MSKILAFFGFGNHETAPKPVTPQKDITAYEVMCLLVAVDPPLRFNEKVLERMPNVQRHIQQPPPEPPGEAT